MVTPTTVRLEGQVERRKRRDAFRVLVGKPEGKKLLGRPRPRLEEG
jgi:hypothetical protein